MEEWRVIITPNLPGALNMAIDQSVARLVSQKKSPATLRLYSWQPHCLSLGYHQSVSDINWAICEKMAIDVVRRPTGGKAVFHADELTYSVIAPATSVIFQSSIAATYLILANWLAGCLKAIGILPELVPQLGLGEKQKLFRNPSCFSTSSEYEITVAGQKIIGSAQRRWPDAVLQHGSVLIGDDYLKIVDLLEQPPDRRKKMLNYLQKQTVFIKQLISEPANFDDLAEVFIQKWRENFKVKLRQERFEQSELDMANSLLEEFVVSAPQLHQLEELN